MQMDVDMGAVSHAYVYLEKLVLMVSCFCLFVCFPEAVTLSLALLIYFPQGKVTKSNRQVVAGE